jgi:hypothetical protein
MFSIYSERKPFLTTVKSYNYEVAEHFKGFKYRYRYPQTYAVF